MRRILLTGLMAALLLGTLSISTASAQLPGLEPVVSDLSETEPTVPRSGRRRTRRGRRRWRRCCRGWMCCGTGTANAGSRTRRRDGQLLPGAVNFIVETGDHLWIGNWDAPEPAIVGVVITEGHRAGLIADRNVVGDPDAPVLITDYSDFL